MKWWWNPNAAGVLPHLKHIIFIKKKISTPGGERSGFSQGWCVSLDHVCHMSLLCWPLDPWKPLHYRTVQEAERMMDGSEDRLQRGERGAGGEPGAILISDTWLLLAISQWDESEKHWEKDLIEPSTWVTVVIIQVIMQ